MLVLSLVVLLAFSGSVMAAESSQTTITANIAVMDYIEVTAPDQVSWELSKANINDNQKYLGTVQVVADTDWSLTAIGDNGGKLQYPSNIDSDNFVKILTTSIEIPYQSLDATRTIGTGTSGSVGVDFYLQNHVESDESGTGVITVTFVGTLIS